jgi:hypothetical protein
MNALPTEQGIHLTAPMHDAKNKRVLVFDTVHDDVFPTAKLR